MMEAEMYSSEVSDRAKIYSKWYYRISLTSRFNDCMWRISQMKILA